MICVSMVTQVQKLTTSLQKLQNSSKDTRDTLTSEVAERHDTILKLKSDVKDFDAKHKEALATVNHRGEVIKQIREELRLANSRVSYCANLLYLTHSFSVCKHLPL